MIQQNVRKKNRPVLMFIFRTVSQKQKYIIPINVLKQYIILIILKMASLDTLFFCYVGQQSWICS